jgi:biotin carboxyl carrier protein
MPYSSTVNEQAYRIETGEEAYQREISIAGRKYAIDWRAIAPLAADARSKASPGGVFSLLIAGKSYEIFARRISTPDEDGSQTYEVQFAGRRFEVSVEDEREKTLAGAASTHDTGEARVRAPMPGLVIGTPLEAGASVSRGQTVVVLEAMKMENDLAAPKAGVIKEVKVSKGQTVNQGDVLVVISGE